MNVIHATFDSDHMWSQRVTFAYGMFTPEGCYQSPP
jgi:hypothetical protein